ncbi:hypothetical protein SAMN05216188_11252 [Lentzea xinjiangensis]|uniref:Uncharacterized protein n=1 Tax=Lentzea xinjiangensis TaxID=402600 RepID=A0A1H9PTQ6_9PSEU|nr:hypothetical protein SAMN05216188_11252 [Lentzea xinjiangensis]
MPGGVVPGGAVGEDEDTGGGVALVLDLGGGEELLLVGAGELGVLDGGTGSELDGGCSASTATTATAASGCERVMWAAPSAWCRARRPVPRPCPRP